MKGLILAGGHGTRLRPLTFTGNKHMIPIANQPMLFYGLRHLAEAGIRDVGIVLGPLHEGIRDAVRDGSSFGLNVRYIHQGDPRGLAHAVLCAREFLAEDPFVMYLGDNLLQEGVRQFVEAFDRGGVEAIVGVTPVLHPERYGVVELDGDHIVSVAEKPKSPKSNLALIGVYLFTRSIHRIIDQLPVSSRGELEITDAIWQLNEQTHSVAVRHVTGWWKDTGRPDDLLEANDLVLGGLPKSSMVISGTVEGGSDVSGPVRLGADSVIEKGSVVEGPVVIGAGTRIDSGAHVGPLTSIGDGCRVSGGSIRRSIMMDSATVLGPVELHDSILGRSASVHSAAERPVKLSCTLGDATELRFSNDSTKHDTREAG